MVANTQMERCPDAERARKILQKRGRCPKCDSPSKEKVADNCTGGIGYEKHPWHSTPAAPETAPPHKCKLPIPALSDDSWLCVECGIIWQFIEDSDGGYWESSGNVEAETLRKEEA